MGQAVVDLPQTPDAAPTPLTSADDLLAQLAGAEIDRMLAESDGELGEQEASNLPKENNLEDASAEVPADEAELNKLLQTARADAREAAGSLTDQAAQKVAPQAPVASQASGDDYSAQVDALFKELSASASAPTAANEAPPSHAAVAAGDVTPLTTEQATTVAERAALAQPVPEPRNDEPSFEPEEKSSLLVRLLEMVNAPFAACPDVLRDALGKVAILTLMNSIGVLLYLYLFRA